MKKLPVLRRLSFWLMLLIMPMLHAQETEEVVVTGIRGSLENSADIKENAGGVTESITAEDLGKFPDVNIAESLQRVPGISISRNRGGEGRFVNIRGLGERFNAVLFNGRLLATENAGREFSFDNIASELVSRVDVFKSSEASQGDGSIGGTVNVITARPLDNSGLQGAWSASGNHDELIDEQGYKFSGVVGNSFANDTFGVLASFIYSKHDFRVDSAESIDNDKGDVIRDAAGATRLAGPDADLATGETRTHAGVLWPTLAFTSTAEERERISGTVAFQWQPTDDLDMNLDLLYTQLESPGIGVAQTNYHRVCCSGPGGLTNIQVAANNVVTAFDLPNYTTEFLNREQQADTNTFAIGLNTVWQALDNLALEADFAYSKAEATRDNYVSGSGSGSFYVTGGITGSRAEYRHTGGKVPNYKIFVPKYDPANPVGAPGYSPSTTLVPLADTSIGDLGRLSGAHFTRETSNEVEDKILSFNLDGTFDLGEDQAFRFGFDYTDREKTNKLFDNTGKWCNYFCGYEFSLRGLVQNLADDTGQDGDALFKSIMRQGPGVSDFLSGTSANVPRHFPSISPSDLRAIYASVDQGDPVYDSEGNQVAANPDTDGDAALTTHDFQALNASGNRRFSINDGSDILKPELRLTGSTDISEMVIGGYGQLDLTGQVSQFPWSGNIGLRIAYTKLESKGHSNEPVSATLVGAGNQNFNFANDTPREISTDYTDLLPSVNLKVEFTEHLLGRFGFSETITRPTLTALSTARTFDGTNLGAESISSGNPELQPTRSNNFDFSLEWYAERNQAAVAFFYKDISDFIANQQTQQTLSFTETTTGAQRVINFNVNRPENGQTAEVYGIELAYTHFFDSGFGLQGNVTVVESEATLDGVTSRLENVSDLSYNLSGFYEANNISARLSYNSRGDYIRTTRSTLAAGLSETVDDYKQLDFTASYTLPVNIIGATDGITLFVEGVNLTDEEEFVYSDGKRNLLRYYEERGRRYFFGLRATF